MDDRDRRFEAQLRRFRPRAPELGLPPARRTPAWRGPWARPAAAAALLLAVALAWTALRSPGPPGPAPDSGAAAIDRQISLGRLNRLLREDPARADAELLRVSPALLPDVQRTGSTLAALAGE